MDQEIKYPKQCRYCAHFEHRGVYTVCVHASWLSVSLPFIFPAVPRVVPADGCCDAFRYHIKYLCNGHKR